MTFDADNLTEVARVSWQGMEGGLHAPVIGPAGHGYAIASDTLFVFPAPHLGGGTVVKTACDVLAPPYGGGKFAPLKRPARR